MESRSPAPTSGSKWNFRREAFLFVSEAQFQRLDQFVELLGFEVLEAHAAAGLFTKPKRSANPARYAALRFASGR